jgi:IS30 family transposase
VAAKLTLRWSPEQICHALVEEFPDDPEMRVSHETIYQALYLQARGGLRREVAAALRTGRARRRPRRDPQARTSRFVDPMVMISERPVEVADRAVPGHWEGDLIIGADGGSAIATLVERATRYVMLVHLPDGRTAEQVRDGLVATMATLPVHLRGSLTWDQGAEMAAHVSFSMATDMPVYFSRSGQPLAARVEREHQRPVAPVLPQRHRPVRSRTRRPRTRRPTTQRPPTQNARLENSSRASASTTVRLTYQRCCNDP